jgi:predicted SAM-dependent methyltransferase
MFIKKALISLSLVPLLLSSSPATTELTANLATYLEHYKNPSIRLHLGCGQSHFNGYINIDFPSSEHTVQTHSPADVYADITKIKVPENCVEEIRSHHLFEHFDRSMALSLLCKWHLWIKPGGVLVIETPDFEASAKVVLSQNYSYAQKQISMRHMFGSHEAHWAIHCDGWYQEKFIHVLSSLGYTDITVQKYSGNKLIPNVTVRAKKTEALSAEELSSRAKKVLRDYMVDGGDESMWRVWCKNFDENFLNYK